MQYFGHRLHARRRCLRPSEPLPRQSQSDLRRDGRRVRRACAVPSGGQYGHESHRRAPRPGARVHDAGGIPSRARPGRRVHAFRDRGCQRNAGFPDPGQAFHRGRVDPALRGDRSRHRALRQHRCRRALLRRPVRHGAPGRVAVRSARVACDARHPGSAPCHERPCAHHRRALGSGGRGRELRARLPQPRQRQGLHHPRGLR